MQLADGNDLQTLMLNAPIGACILDAATLIAETVNDKFLEIAGKPYQAIQGRFYWDAFAEARPYHETALAGAVESGKAYYADEVGLLLVRRGQKETVLVTFVYSPVKNKDDQVIKVAVWALENTQQVKSRQAINGLNEELAATNKELRAANEELNATQQELRQAYELSGQQQRVYETITSATPDLMYVFGLDYRFTYANNALLTMWGKSYDNAVGKSLLENGYEAWHAEMHEREIDQVITTKQPIRGEVSFPHAILGRRVYDYIFTPVLNAQGEVEAIAGTTRDVSERKQWEETLARTSEDLQLYNEELAAVNEELAASNEQLRSANEELAQVNEQLLAARNKIEEHEVSLRLAVDAANFGTWYINSVTREFISDAPLKEMFGYYPHEDMSIGQALAQITEEYREYVAAKLEDAIDHNGDYDVTYPVVGLHDNRFRWLRAIGNLKADPSGAFSAFTGVVMDITDQVQAKISLESAYEQLRLSKEAAELGFFDMDLTKGTMEWDARCRELFGISHTDTVTYEKDFVTGLHPEDKERVLAIINDVFIRSVSNGVYDVEYRTVGAEDQQLRWVRAKGQAYFNPEDKPVRFIGSVLDITEQKQDEIRKNDFIGMVSHELKTPLTSLTAIIQMANLKLKSSDDAFLAGAMEKANVQAKRMSNMINGFLNVSRLESAKLSIDKHEFDLEDLIEDIVKETKLSVSSHGIEFNRCNNALVNADHDKIGSVITNLISNAIKYSPKGKSVEVKCVVAGNDIQVSVKDEGYGLKPQDTGKVFDRYYRAENNNTRNISGFGIGLYLSAEIINRHNGKIWVESEVEKGATFYFSLPR